MTDGWIGVTLDEQYEIEELLAEGGMSTVYRARDVRHDRTVAVKVLRVRDLGTALAQRFEREVEVASGLVHPHILPLFGSGVHDGRPYYVMPFMTGETLRERISDEKQLPVADAVRIAKEVADALDRAHRAGITHRDIKPENILLEGGHAIVADFGLASSYVEFPDGGGLTLPGTTLGTPRYMSPEQASGERVDRRSDVYSLACVLYETLTGEVPLTGPTHQNTVFRRRTETPTAVSSFRRRISPRLERALQRALEANPADRFQTAAEFRDELDAILAGQRPGDGTWRGAARSPAFAVVVTLAVVVAAGLTAWISRPPTIADPAGIRLASVAVLPFERGPTGDPGPTGQGSGLDGEDYLVAGVGEELRHALSRVHGLLVASLESSEVAARREPRDAGRSLGVDGLVHGSVSRSRGGLRVSVRLTDSRTDRQLWGRVFTAESDDLFGLTASMADSLVRAMGIDGAAPTRPSHTPDVGTQNMYLQARFAAGDRSRESLERAIDFYRRAISRDSLYTSAWAGLASTLALTGVYEYRSWDDLRQEAEVAAAVAIRLDSTSAEAHRAQGILQDYRFAWDRSEEAYEAAIRYNSNDAEAYHWFAVQHVLSGTPEGAGELIQEALRLNPLSISIKAAAGWIAYYQGDVPGAIGQLEAAREMEANSWIALVYLALAYADQGRVDEGLEFLGRARELNPDSPMLGPVRARLEAQRGRPGEARRLLQSVDAGTAPPAWMAIAYLSLGDLDQALSWLDRGYRESPPSLIEINTFWFEPLRSHPRFRALVAALHSGAWLDPSSFPRYLP